jgi:Protein of unknown function (DUF2515)
MYNKTVFQRFLPIISKNKRKSEWVAKISSRIDLHNLDNISRTLAYQRFYMHHPEIKWSLLASLVSRNAGWNMTDLKGAWYPLLLKEKMQHLLFLTYEKANWCIFQDAFPQLLIYHYSTLYNENLFHLLEEFHVSQFMIEEWNRYWEQKDGDRLMQALIINEQNVIQKPVIEHPLYKRKIFRSGLFFVEDHFHFNSVVFPTITGELYGASAHDFRSLDKRIRLGNILSQILFDKELYPHFLTFSLKTVPTGSRKEYERYCKDPPYTGTSILRTIYPIVNHHIREYEDWSQKGKVKKKWFKKSSVPDKILLTDWFFQKQRQIQKLILLKEKWTK